MFSISTRWSPKLLPIAIALAGVLIAPSISATPEFPLHDAIRSYDSIAFLAALEAGNDLDARDAQGNPPLHLAVAQRNTDLVLALLFMGASPLAENAAGQTAAEAIVKPRGMTGAEWRRIETIRHHLQSFASASPPMPDHPLAQASFFIAASRSIESLMRESVEAGADPNRPKNEKEETALHKAEGAVAVRTLAELGANLEALDVRGATPLIHAAIDRNSAKLQALIDVGAAVEVRSRDGASPLTEAIRRSQDGRTADVKALLKAGAPITLSDLQIAIALRRSRTLRSLLRADSTPAPESTEGQKLLFGVQQRGSDDVRTFVRSHPTYGPALMARERAQAREREEGIAAFGAMIAPHAMIFGLLLTALPFLFAVLTWTWVAKPVRHAALTATFACLAIVLAYFPSNLREGLSSIRFFDTTMTHLPLALAGMTAALTALTAATVAPVVFLGMERKLTGKRRKRDAVVANGLCAGLFVLLFLHNSERVEALDQTYRRVVVFLQWVS